MQFNHRADIARVPDWVHDAVVYNIFPDSFATSHQYISKNPTALEYNGQTVKGKLGGTLHGVTENADYLKDLGINCVYINPIFAFDDVVRNQEKSQYCDWFYHLEFAVERPEMPEIYPTCACFAYERMMPKLDTANPKVCDYFCKVGRYWVEEFGIDGWRLDDGFWRAFRQAIKEVNPDALLIGEVWESANHWLQGDMFDSASMIQRY